MPDPRVKPEAPALPADLAIIAIVARASAFADGHRNLPNAVVEATLGLGKSHVLTGSRNELRRLRSTADLRIAVIHAGSSAISGYDDLLYEIILARAGTIDADTVGKAAALRAERDRASLEQLAFRVDDQQSLLIMIDDFDHALTEFGEQDLHALEALLESESAERPLFVVSSSGRAKFGQRWDIIPLRPLSPDEALALVNAKLPDGARPIVSAAELIDDSAPTSLPLDAATLGSPSFWALVASYLDGGRSVAVPRAVEAWTTQLSGVIAERLASLAPAERRIVVELARAGKPMTVTGIATSIGATNPSTASALGRLYSARWVQRVEAAAGADRRSTWYDIVDPLLRTHLTRREQTDASRFVASTARAWLQISTDSIGRSEPVPTVKHRMAEAEEVGNTPQDAEVVGLAAQEERAADMLREIVWDAVREVGLTDSSTLEAMMEWGRWVGEASDRRAAVEMLTRTVRDCEAVLGKQSPLTLEAMSRLSWNQIQMRDYSNAEVTLREIQRRAAKLGDEGTGIRIGAFQNEAIVVGEHGDPARAVRLFEQALEMRRTELPDDPLGEAWCRHGLAYWTAKAGEPERAIAMFDALKRSRKRGASQTERLGYEVDKLTVERDAAQGDLAAASPLVERYLRVAEQADAVSDASRIGTEARQAALEIAADTRRPDKWPIEGVAPDWLGSFVATRLRARSIDVAQLDPVLARATELQLASIAIAAVFGVAELNVSERSELAKRIGRLSSADYGLLLRDFAKALAGDGTALSSLPSPWRGMLAEIEALGTSDTQQGNQEMGGRS